MGTGTNFSHPVRVGDPFAGVPSADNRGFTLLTQRIDVSAGDVGNFVVIPPNSRISTATRFMVTDPITGSAGGVLVVLGKTEGTNEYAQVAASASGAYTFTFKGAIASAAGTVACKLQPFTSASAEAMAGIRGYVDLVYTVVG